MAQKKWYNFSDYKKALEDVLSDIPPVVIIEGEEQYLRQVAVERIQKKIILEYPQAAEVNFYGPTVQGEGKFNFTDLLVELSSASLFSSEKIITFRCAQRSLFVASSTDNGSKKISPVQSLAEYIKKPTQDNFFIIEVEKINRQRIIGKAMLKSCIIPCPVLTRQSDVIYWMKSEAHDLNKELDPEAASILHRAYGADLGVLASEIDKLAIYVGEERHITSEDVEQFLSGTVEFSIFELTNALEKRNLAGALKFIKLICEQGCRDQSGKRQDGLSSAHQSMALISSLLENLIQARALIAEQLPVHEIIKDLGLHPKRAEGIVLAANRFTLDELQYSLNVMANEMKSAHDTGADPKFSLERVAISICKKRNTVM